MVFLITRTLSCDHRGFPYPCRCAGDAPLSLGPPRSTAVKARAAELVHDMRLDAPAAPLILRPNSGGNVHEFTAVTACAMLDVLAPPYDPYGRRPCTYYQKQEGGGLSRVCCFAVASDLTLFFSFLCVCTGRSTSETSWLTPTRQPRWLQMREDAYRGPNVSVCAA